MLAGTVMIIGTVILASSTTIAQLIAGRIITGVVSTDGFKHPNPKDSSHTRDTHKYLSRRGWVSIVQPRRSISESAALRNIEEQFFPSRA